MNHHPTPNSKQRSAIITDHRPELSMCPEEMVLLRCLLVSLPNPARLPHCTNYLRSMAQANLIGVHPSSFFLKLKERRMVFLWPWIWEAESAEIAAPSWTTASLSEATTSAEKQSSAKRPESWGHPEAPVQLGLTQVLPWTSQLLQVIPFLFRLWIGLSDTCLRKGSSFLPLSSILILSENKILLFLSDENKNVIQETREIPLLLSRSKVVERVLWQSRARGNGKKL